MAALPPNLNIPAGAGVNPTLQNPGVDATETKQENQEPTKDEQKNISGSNFARKVRNTCNLWQLFLALPLLANSFVLQADNISDQVKDIKDPGVVGYVANSFETLSSVFKTFVDKFVAGGKTVDKIETNRSANLTQNFPKRILHPNITREFTSLLFNARRIMFNLFPNVFTVPSADHDPLNPGKNTATKSTATLYGIMASVTSPLVKLSSVFALIATVPSHLMGSYFTYTGNQEAYTATKYFNRISEIFTPLMSNLSSLLSVSKSYIDSYYGKDDKSISKFVTRGRYNVNWTNMVQGLVGSVTSIPYFFGVLGKLREVVQEKDIHEDYLFSTNLKTLADNILPNLEPYKDAIKFFKPNYDLDTTLTSFKASVEKGMTNFDGTIKTFLDSLFNTSPLMKNLFSQIRPSDSVGNVQAFADNHTVESNDNSDYAFGFIRKVNFFREIFDWLHPIQSMLMLLPNSIITPEDPYVNDNSKRFGRRLDRLFGFNSMLLSLPNYLIYAATTRVPQLLLKGFEYKERQHRIDKNNNDGFTNKVNGYQSYQNTLNLLKRLPIIGTHFLAKKLESLNINENTFVDEKEFRLLFEELDTSARKQESSVKASELVGATRIGFRTLLENEAQKGKSLFFAKRDEAGLTDDEKTRKGFYESVGKFKNIIGKIPVVGWVASPILEAFRNIYKVDTTKRRHIAAPSQDQQQKILEALNQATAPNADLAA